MAVIPSSVQSPNIVGIVESSGGILSPKWESSAREGAAFSLPPVFTSGWNLVNHV
ncbi:MAG: hypothetical protein H7844_08380 [Nitrospirae bacterium YQR-1]